MERCINCGAPVTVTDYMSATQCEHCGCYIIFDERVEGKYRPHLMVPFALIRIEDNIPAAVVTLKNHPIPPSLIFLL